MGVRSDMRILQVTPYFTPFFGGSSEASYQLSKELAKRGHQVTVYTSDCKLADEPLFTVPRATIYPFKTWSRGANFYVTPSIIAQIKRQIGSFDIIHLHNYRTFQNIVAHQNAVRNGIPYILQAHGSLPRIVNKQGLKKVYDGFWGRRLLRDATKVIAVTEAEAEQFREAGVDGDRIEIIPNGIDLHEFSNLPSKGEFRRKHGLDSDQRIILYLGRIHPIKGLDLLIRAFASLPITLSDIKLVIVGYNSKYLVSLKKLAADLGISDDVLFVGGLFGQEKLEAYVDADVYVLPSVYGIFDITVLEAIACGTPVIITDTSGIAGIVKSQVGLVVPRRVLELRLAIQELLANDKLRSQFGDRGRMLVRKEFNWQIVASQVESMYKEVLR